MSAHGYDNTSTNREFWQRMMLVAEALAGWETYGKLARMWLLVPVGTVESERSQFILNHLRGTLRTQLGEEHGNTAALLYTCPIQPDLFPSDEAVAVWNRTKRRS
jgi:hypothetical protein